MELIPAIDLKDGNAVRLSKGVMESARIYSGTPLDVAKRFEDMGAKWLHIVDLNGAFAGKPQNLEQIELILRESALHIQIGGGIRDEATIRRYINLGVKRVILGSVAAKDPQYVVNLSENYPIVVGIDAKEGQVALEGWGKSGGIDACALAKRFANSEVAAIICTDINKDGMLSGPNIEFTQSIKEASGLPTIASGGVSGMEDLIALKEAGGIDGVIIGKAFYEGRLDLAEAFKTL